MNPYLNTGYADSITAALTGGNTGEPWTFARERPTVAPTVDPNLQTVSMPVVPFPQAKQLVAVTVNETPYVKTTRAGVKLSETKMDKPDASLVESKLTKEQIENYTRAAIYGSKAIASFANGFTSNISYKMQARNKEWQAKQNERSARLLLMNQREINRAAQADANVYRVQGAAHKSGQKVAMAQSGFAVGKGIYRNTLDTTDVRTNYNTSAIILKAELQNAELVRRAGLYEAEAIINKADAAIARKMGKAALWDGILDGIVYSVAAGTSFYYGKHPLGGTTKTETKTTTKVS